MRRIELQMEGHTARAEARRICQRLKVFEMRETIRVMSGIVALGAE